MPELADTLLAQSGVSQIMLVRWWDFMRVRRDGELRKCARSASLVVPVSISLVMGARFLRRRRLVRHLPFDFVIRLLGALEDRQRSIYLLGGTHQTLRTVEQNLRGTFPGLRCVGRYTGFHGDSVESDILTAIRKAEPDLVLLGTGVPAGEKWAARHRSDLGTCIAIHSPDTFEIFAEKRQRTSRAAFKRGLDFVPDLVRRPWRVLRFPVYLWYLLLLAGSRVFRR
jgi:N-acetylglucosaminyldiphosphoundecaprenol N-acetyl-beta-D-mannosaminyltransferase